MQEYENNSLPGSRNAWWYSDCNICQKSTEHITQVGCVECAKRKEEEEEGK